MLTVNEIFHSVQCVAVVPSMLKGGFVFGAKWGSGVATCRTPSGWSAPAFFQIRGGSWGSIARTCRSAYREGAEPSSKNPCIGFRPAFHPLP